MENSPKTGRRDMLKRGLIALAGIVGIGVVGRGAVAADRGGAAATVSLQLYGRRWHLYSQDRASGTLPVKGDQMVAYGELLDAPDGQKVGEFYSTCYCTGTPFGSGPLAAASIEMHTLKLQDGTIVGMGTPGSTTGGESVHAVIGGTGRYLGASGSYVANQRPQELGGDGTAEFTLTLTSLREV